jgi:hypothetical protein
MTKLEFINKVLQTQTGQKIKQESFTTLDHTPTNNTNDMKTRFEEQLAIECNHYKDPRQILEATLVNLGRSDSRARISADTILYELGMGQPMQERIPERGINETENYMGRNDNEQTNPGRNSTNEMPHSNNPLSHFDSIQGLPVETQMAYASLSNRTAQQYEMIGSFSKDMPFEDPSDRKMRLPEKWNSKQKMFADYVRSVTKKLSGRKYTRIPVGEGYNRGNDTQMGRKQVSDGAARHEDSATSQGGTDFAGLAGIGGSPFGL